MTDPTSTRGQRLVPAANGPSTTASTSDATLPADLEQAAVRRLGHVCLVAAASSAALGFVPPLLESHAPLHVLSTLPAVIVSLLAYAAVASGRISVRRLLALGLVYQVVLGFLVAVDFHSAAIAPAGFSRLDSRRGVDHGVPSHDPGSDRPHGRWPRSPRPRWIRSGYG